MFSLRIVSTVHYQAKPIPDLDVTYSPFRSADVKKVPILCIFGATPAGQKTCMHLHGVFPYLYVLYDGSQPLDSYLRRFAASLDKAINVANNSNASTHHVFKITLVTGFPMYGYHAEEKQFLKIYLYNPNFIRKAADLLIGGAVMNKSFQPHEAHIPFPLQLFMDYNLYGMNLINIGAVKFRANRKDEEGNIISTPPTSSTSNRKSEGSLDSPDSVESIPFNTPSMRLWDVAALPSDLLLPASVERHSTCELEVDAVAADILNRKDVEGSIGGNPGLAALWEDERQRKRNAGQVSQITPEDSQEHEAVEAAESEKKLLDQLAEIIQHHQSLRRSQSEESDVSMEDVTVVQTAVSSLPASQIENHTELTEVSQRLSSQDTTVVVEEEEDESPVISMESIQRVLSFSQSFSRPSSQISASSASGGGTEEAGDHTLAKMLASLAEESSPVSSQQSVMLAALEDQDCIVGHSMVLPPEPESLEKDEEDTLEMSQILPGAVDVPDEERFNLEGMDVSWSGSPNESIKENQDGRDIDIEESDEVDEDEDIPQLDGASDEKPAASSKSSKKRLGVRGPVVPGGQGAPTSAADPQISSPAPHQYNTMVPPGQQQQAQTGSFSFGYNSRQQQWMGDSNTGQTYGMTTFSRTSSTGQSSSWPHSPPQGCYPAIYGQSRLVPSQGQPSTSGFGYYGHTQNFNSAAGSAGTVPGRQAQDEPHFPFISTGFSPPPGSPTYYPGGCGSIQSFQQQSPFQQGPYVQPHQEPFQQPHQTASASPQGMTGIRRHSEGSIPQPVLQNPSQDPVSSHYTASPLTSTHHETPWLLSSSDTDSRDTESTISRLPHQTSTLQALLEAPTTSTCLDLRSPPLSVASSNMVRRTVSVDSNPVAFIRRGMEPGIMNIGQFKLPDKRLSSNGDSCGMSVLGHSDVSAPALSSLFNLVENVDPLGGTSSPTPTLVPTPTSTPTSTPTPTSASSPSVQSKDEEVKTYMDLSSGQVKVSPRPSPVPNIESRMLMEEALPLVAAGENMSPSVTLWRYTGSIIDDALLEQADMELVSPSNCSSRESIASAPVVGARKIENDRLGKQVRMKKLGFSHQRMLMHGSGEGFTALTSPSSSSLYTYTFHVPTPVFKRLKLQSIYPHREPDVKLVHMHPKDARRYSLLKIGRELVRLTRLSAREIANISNALRFRGASRSATERPHSPHNSLVDPQTGEVLMSRIQSRSTSSMLPENKSGSVVIMQSSRLPGTSRQLGSKSKRLLGPRCKRLKKFSDAKCQTVVSALESTVPPGPQSGGEGVYEMRPEQIHLHSKSSHLFSYSSGQKGTKKQSDVSVHSVSPATKTNELVLSMPSQSPLFTSGWKQPSSVKSEIGADDQQSKFLPNPGVPGPGQYSDQWNSDSNHSHSGGSWRMESPQGVPKPWSEGSGQLGNGGTWQSGCYLGWQPQYPGVKSEREHMQNRIRPDANSGLVSSPNTCLSSSWSAPVSPSVSLASFNSTMLSSSSSRPLAASFCESPTVTSVPVQQTGVSSTRVHYTHSYGTYTPVHYSHPSPEEFTEDSYASQMGSQKSYHDGCSTYSLHDSQTGSQTTFGSPTHYSSFMGSGYLEGQHNQFSPPGTQHCQFFPAGQGDQHTTCLPLNRSVHYPASGSSHTATYQSTQNTLHSIGAHGHNAGGQPGNFMVQQKGFPAYSQAGSQNNFSPDSSQHEKYSSSAGQPPNGSPQCPVPANSSESWQHESQTQDSSANGNSSKLFLDHSNQLQPFLQKGACQDTNTAASDLAREPATSFLKSQSICPVRPVISIGAVPVPSPMLTSYQELENSSQQLQSLSPTIPPSQHRAEQPRNFHGSFVNSHPPVKLRNSEGSAVESSDDDDEEGARASRSRKNRTKISQSVVKTYNCMSDVTPKELSYNLQIVNHGQRKVTLEMFSTDESEGDETDDSSDEYIPSSSSRLRGTKRKKRRKAEKRAKRMSVNYSRNAFSHFLEEKEQREHRRGRSRKRHQQRSDHKDDKLIEGIHYIIVGKFKGHRVMLVKVHKVKVGLNERVVVSKWLASREGSKMKDVCYRSPDSPTYFSKDTSNESTHADKHFFHTGTQDDPECLSDASTIIGDFGQTVGTSDETAEQKIPMEIPYTREGESKDGAYSHGKNNCLHRENREATGCTVHSANREKGGLRDQSLKHTLGSCKDMHENLLNGSGSVVSMLSPQAPGTFSDGCLGNRGAAGMIKEIIDCDGKISFRHEVDEGNGEVEKQQDGVSVSRQCEGVLSVYGALEKMVTTEDTETSAAGREKWELSALTKSASTQNSVQDPAVLQKIKNPFSDHRNPSGSAACHSCSESSLTLKQNLSREALNSGRPKSKLMSTKGKKPKMNKSAEKSKKKFVSEDLLSIRESSKDILLSEAKLGRKLLKAARENCSFQVQESKCTSLLKQCAANNFIFKQGTAPESLEPCQHELESRRKAPVDWGPGVTMPDPEASSGGCGNDVDGQKDKDAFITDSSPSKKYQPIDGNQPGSGSKQDWDDERSVGDPKHPQCILNRGPEDVGQDEKTTSSQQSPAKPYSSAAPPLSRGETQNLMEGSSGPVYVEHEPDHAMNLEPTQPEYVLRPQLNPPLREALEASCVSFGLSIEPVVKAFCSNPTDLPEKPRELGGRVLRLVSCRVADLEEMKPPAGIQGLQAWQSIKLSSSSLLASQSQAGVDRGSFRERLAQKRQLHSALIGDCPCIMTPVTPPPSVRSVMTWIQNKLTILEAKKGMSGGQTEPSTEVLGLSEVGNRLQISQKQENYTKKTREEDEREDSADTPMGREGLFTILKDKGTEPGSSKTFELAHISGHKASSQDIHVFLGSPEYSHLDPTNLHSTLVEKSLEKTSQDELTPITSKPTGEQTESIEQEPEHTSCGQTKFVTPKRLPLRRLSTNTERVLRQNILASQAKLGFVAEGGYTSQIDGPTPKNTHGFVVTQRRLQDAKALHSHQYLTVLSLELHAETRGDLMPDPEVDAIHAIFYAIFDDIPLEKGSQTTTGVMMVDAASCDASKGRCGPGSQTFLSKCGLMDDLDITYVATETDLLMEVIKMIDRTDPDMLVGFEVQQLSWGFLLQRAAQLNIDLCTKIARVHGLKRGSRVTPEKDEWGADHTSEFHIDGRIVLNLWRVLRHEVTLNVYTYENCAYHVLHKRVPAYTFRTLTFWYSHGSHLHRWRVINHYTERVTGQLAMLDQLDIIGKTSEFARVFGIEFYDVLSRGSQYRVESMMLRLAKPLNFIPVSPSIQQRARQKSAECIALNLEPESRFYVDPVVVLDFQSLYPSIMIAYNYCFSTCLGRVQHLASAHEGPIEFGCTSLNVPPTVLRKLEKHVTISPNGCVFVKQNVRKGILPLMVDEILRTRLMVKKSMKAHKGDKKLHRMLDARQLGLKLIANVTYGYTGASFSGRMPCVEVGDSIVRKARESLERAIGVVEKTTRWQAHVVYGDTDSLFVHLPGRTKDQAFVIGQEIADTITNMFPKPMKLRFEKVYLPCVLQTKKRYVGFMYETPDQKEPVFDAKGIETVRRDNCGVVSKVLEKSIKILFTSRDVSLVKAYVQNQCTKMLSGHVGLQDFIFAKEYKGMMGYKPGACVPALEVARRRLRDDRRAEPRVGERVPYVVVYGSPGLPLIKLVRQPLEVVQDCTLRINVTYYIQKLILPCLDRMLGLIGANVFSWYEDLPRVHRVAPHGQPLHPDMKQGTISQYFVTSDCALCDQQTKQLVCSTCLRDPLMVAVSLASRCTAWERVQDSLSQICFACMGIQDHTQPCTSLDCPVLFRRLLAKADIQRADRFRGMLDKILSF